MKIKNLLFVNNFMSNPNIAGWEDMYHKVIVNKEIWHGVVTNISKSWSNIIGILPTNSFSIVGTIMGVKYASESKEK